ncbi:MAG TPA: hypothetical protein DCY79_07495 [Planctomycetaceae bacterium]|nr:hypothetical protein [Planctomycetaceae bacterium]
MHLRRLILLIAMSGVCTTPAVAGDLLHAWHPARVCDCIGKWCCPDYCPKRAPCATAPCKTTCDNYCAKPAPGICATITLGCDDYCPKCPPRPCRTPLCAWLKCRPAGAPQKTPPVVPDDGVSEEPPAQAAKSSRRVTASASVFLRKR